jgi:hypothetical protein
MSKYFINKPLSDNSGLTEVGTEVELKKKIQNQRRGYEIKINGESVYWIPVNWLGMLVAEHYLTLTKPKTG